MNTDVFFSKYVCISISNRKDTRIRYDFVLELSCYRVCYIRDICKILKLYQNHIWNLVSDNVLHYVYKGK